MARPHVLAGEALAVVVRLHARLPELQLCQRRVDAIDHWVPEREVRLVVQECEFFLQHVQHASEIGQKLIS